MSDTDAERLSADGGEAVREEWPMYSETDAQFIKRVRATAANLQVIWPQHTPTADLLREAATRLEAATAPPVTSKEPAVESTTTDSVKESE